ncbi:MAG: mycothione reductase [Acidimicrobiia bacterium]
MREYDLIVIGGGSGNSIFGPEFDHLRCAVIEPDRFGGTCLNRGCVPSKMFVVAADTAETPLWAGRLGIDLSFNGADWPAIRDRVFARIDPLHASAVRYRESVGIDVFTDPARFVAPKVLQVGDEQLTATDIVVACGARPMVPEIEGIDSVSFHTSDTVMRLDALPESMIILGGGFIAVEMGHVFSGLGTQVTVVQRGPRLLMAEDEEISLRFTDVARPRLHAHTNSTLIRVEPHGDGVAVTMHSGASERTLFAEVLLVATGRIPNTDRVDAAAGGLELDGGRRVVVDEHFRTNVDGVWALGDVANDLQLKHLANAETRVVKHNLANPDDLRTLAHPDVIPHAVFTDPQIAAVGLTEARARATDADLMIGVRPYSATAYGWALEDTTSFAKVIADRQTRLILGAHIMGPYASMLIQPVVQAMTFGQTVDEIGREVMYLHPALTEVLEQVLLEF